VQYNPAANLNSAPTLTYGLGAGYVVGGANPPGSANFNRALSNACR
jgi:hypothetical protein